MEVRAFIRKKNGAVDEELKGAWFTAPINFDHVAEELGLENARGQYEITEIDCELPLWLADRDDIYIKDVNAVYRMILELLEDYPERAIKGMINEWFRNVEDFYRQRERVQRVRSLEIGEIDGIKYIYNK